MFLVGMLADRLSIDCERREYLRFEGGSADIGEEESFSNDSENNTSVGDESMTFYEVSKSSLEECVKDNKGSEKLMSEITFIAPSKNTFIAHNITTKRWF